MHGVIYNILRFIYQTFGIPRLPKADYSKRKLNGAVLFSNEYTNANQFNRLNTAYKNEPVMRIPFSHDKNTWNSFKNTIINLSSRKITPLILLDCYFNDQSMRERISYLKNIPCNYIQLFNELPHMPYPGEQLTGLDDLINKTNIYSQLIKQTINNAQIVSMSPANSLHYIEYDKNWKTNEEQLIRLCKLDSVDIIGLHCYVTSKNHEFNFKYLINTLKKHNKKHVWITETGIEGWGSHINFYNEWTSRFNQYIPNINRIIWYRQTIDNINSSDGTYSLHDKSNNSYSPLFEIL